MKLTADPVNLAHRTLERRAYELAARINDAADEVRQMKVTIAEIEERRKVLILEATQIQAILEGGAL